MGPLTDAELAQRVQSSAQVRKYAQAIDRESAEEKLAAKPATDAATRTPRGRATRAPAPSAAESSPLEKVLTSSVTKSVARSVAVAVAGTLVRGLMGALLGSTRRRRY
jgi:hypothetical protein